MKLDVLVELINAGESQQVELKEGCPANHELSEIMCAFANTDGGFLILGVSANRTIKGLSCDHDKLQQTISNASQAVISPPLVSTTIHRIDNKVVVAVEIQRTSERNAHTYKGSVFVRIGSTVRKLEGQALFEFLKNRQILCFDEQDSNAGLDDLDNQKIQSYLIKRGNPDFLKENSLKDFIVSNQLGRANGKVALKNVACLFFSKEPNRWFNQNEVRIVRFAGTDPINIISQKDFQDDPISNIEQAIHFIRKNISKRFIIPENSPQRIEIEEYPLQVIREAVVNAVVHRDYYSYDSIQINMFDDRIEITNPGSLPQGLPVEFFGRRSVRRNPLSYKLLRDCKYVEGLGTGIPRMFNEMRKAGLRDPEFNFEGGFFVVTLRNMKSILKPIEGFKDLNQRQLNAIQFLKQNKTIKSTTYANINSVSVPTALKDIAELLKFKYIRKTGKYRGAYYTLNEEKIQ